LLVEEGKARGQDHSSTASGFSIRKGKKAKREKTSDFWQYALCMYGLSTPCYKGLLFLA